MKWLFIAGLMAVLSVTRDGYMPFSNPGDISGLVLWIDPAQGVTLDGSSRVSQIVDQSSNGVVFTQATAGSRPDIHSSAINGLPALRADGTTRLLGSAAQTSITDYTIFAVMKTALSAQWFSKGSTQTLNELFLFSGSNVTLVQSSYDGLGAYQHFYQGISCPNTGYTSFQTYCITKQGMHVALYLDGTRVTPTSGQSAVYINPLGEPWYLFGRDGSQNTEIAYLLVYNRRLNTTQLGQVNGYIKTKFGTSYTFTPSNTDLPGIFFVGNSISAGVLSVAPCIRTMDDGTVGLNHSGRVWDSANSAIAGDTWGGALATINTTLIPWLNNGDIVEVWLGTNDIRTGRTTAATIADIDAYCTAIRNTGKNVKIVLTTILNASDFTGGKGSIDGAESGFQATINVHIRGLVGTLCDAVYDAQHETNLQTTSTAPNTYSADGLHLTTAGENIISNGWIAAINGL